MFFQFSKKASNLEKRDEITMLNLKSGKILKAFVDAGVLQVHTDMVTLATYSCDLRCNADM